jgi:hypothetical protein
MSKTFEEPISELVSSGYNAVVKHIKNDGPWRLFCWFSLIFLKTHLKDKALRFHLDKRKGAETIADNYVWEMLHHVHCVARSFYTKAALDKEILGSFFVLPAKQSANYEHFDYRDLYEARTILLRLEDICFIAVLNDSCASSIAFCQHSEKLSGTLSPIQLREVMAHLAHINLHLKKRPQYYSLFSSTEGYQIVAELPPSVELEGDSQEEFGRVFFACTEDILRHFLNRDIEEIKDHVRHGRYSFLFDKDGNFLQDSMKLLGE